MTSCSAYSIDRFIEALDDPSFNAEIHQIITKIARRESKLLRHRKAQDRYRNRIRSCKIQELKLMVCLLSKIRKLCEEISVLEERNQHYADTIAKVRDMMQEYALALERILHGSNFRSTMASTIADKGTEALDAQTIFSKALRKMVLERMAQNGTIQELVRTSYDQVMENSRYASAQYDTDKADILGWTDQRQINDNDVRFMFTKFFGDGDVTTYSNRTFETSLVYEKYRQVQNWVTNMSVLEKVNDDTYIMLRENAAPNSDFRFRTVYLLFRVVADGGNTVVVATRSLEDCVQDMDSDTPMPYIKALYSFIFTKTPVHADRGRQSPTDSSCADITSTGGCCVQLGGQVSCGNLVGAKILISEAVQCALRWENHCVTPLFQFS